jgi:alkane 1-monooxygenase
MPSGHAAMVPLADFPALCRREMDNRGLAYYNGDVTQANVQPGPQARYGVPA